MMKALGNMHQCGIAMKIERIFIILVCLFGIYIAKKKKNINYVVSQENIIKSYVSWC